MGSRANSGRILRRKVNVCQDDGRREAGNRFPGCRGCSSGEENGRPDRSSFDGGIGEGAPGGRPFRGLAEGTEVEGAGLDRPALDGKAATGAGTPFPSIDQMESLVSSNPAIFPGEGVDGGAAFGNGSPEDRLHGEPKGAYFPVREGAAFPEWGEPRLEKNLGHVDVSDSRHQALVHERRPERARGGSEKGPQFIGGNGEGVRSGGGLKNGGPWILRKFDSPETAGIDPDESGLPVRKTDLEVAVDGV